MQSLMLVLLMHVWVHVASLSRFYLRVKLLGSDLLLRCQRGLESFPRKEKMFGKSFKKADTKEKNKMYRQRHSEKALS